MLLIALSLGSFIGLILGLTGAGGGILAVPALTLVLGWTMAQASPIALLSVGSATAIGAMKGLKKGLVRYRAATLISITGIAATPFGQHLAHILPERWLVGLFATVMLIVAVRLWHNAGNHTLSDDGVDSEPSRVSKIQIQTGRIIWNVTSFVTLSLIGILTGLTTGLLGVGGGFIIVPALLHCSNITLDGIVATSLMVIALVSGGAIVSAWATGYVVMSAMSGLFILGAIFGTLLGSHYAENIPKQHTLRFFALMIAAVSLILFYRAMH
jgi:uncharacterized membrane protein YfcA